MLCQFYKNRFFALLVTDYFLYLHPEIKHNNNFLNITTMAEDKNKKQKEEELQNEQLDEVSGGAGWPWYEYHGPTGL